ncbi:MAG: low-specificity L-threonine aldolase [Synergistaceae bacterium]|nr:low-specificity L-threonine aldolase [Synergistaceae bacterium]
MSFETDLFPVDLRSDTVTKPSAEMRKAISEAEVGDDVFGEDPTVRRLEKTAAEMLGKEAALYVISGTQGNLVSLLTHCSRGDAVILGRDSHLANMEGGGLAALGGIVPIQADDPKGLPSVAELDLVLPPTDNVHLARARILCVENTHSRCGAHASSPEEIFGVAAWAHKRGLLVHMDGARLFNAAVALKAKPSEFVKEIDSVQICLSKGLGAPMGSLICASSAFIHEARFWRKKVGGGMRQAGIAAAAGLFALSNNVSRLADDHASAQSIFTILKGAGIQVLEAERPTNMVYFSVSDERSANKLFAACRKRGVFFGRISPVMFRIVTHLDVCGKQAQAAAKVIAEEYGAL